MNRAKIKKSIVVVLSVLALAIASVGAWADGEIHLVYDDARDAKFAEPGALTADLGAPTGEDPPSGEDEGGGGRNRSGGGDGTNPGGGGNRNGYDNPGNGNGRR